MKNYMNLYRSVNKECGFSTMKMSELVVYIGNDACGS